MALSRTRCPTSSPCAAIRRTSCRVLAGGAKTAGALLRRSGTLEQVLADGRFAEEAEALRLYKRIATMDATAPLPALEDQTPTWEVAAALAREWALPRLAGRLEEICGAGPNARAVTSGRKTKSQKQ